MNVLLAEDDRSVRESLVRALTLEGYDVTAVTNGAEALAHCAESTPDVLLLDVSMPVVDGLTVCRVLRSEKNRIPILMLTARTETRDRVAGLDAGADDYLPKPFDLAELFARVRALLRRANHTSTDDAAGDQQLVLADLRIDPAGRRVWRGNREIECSKTEYELLELLVRNAGIVLDHSTIYERIWNYDFGPDSKNLAVYIGYVRRKTEADGEPRLVHTVRGVGYTAGRHIVSLRWRIALALGAIAATTTIVVGVISYRTTRDQLYDEIDQSLTDSITLLERELGRPGEFGRLPERGPLSFYDIQVLGPDGRVLASNFDRGFEPHSEQAALVGANGLTNVQNMTIEDAEYRVRTVGLPRGAFQIARPLDETNRVLDSLRARLLILVLGVTAAGAAAGFLIAGGVTASLRRLTAAAEAVETTGQLDVDVPADGHDEVGRLSAAFRRMLNALARSRDDQQRLVQDAGHELRTPLTSLRTNLDVLRRYPDLPADQRRQVVDDLHAETEELVLLVEEVVAVASGALDDDPFEPFSLGDVTRELAARYERRSGREVRVEADESPVEGQLGAVQRAISNLLDNARKFDPSGGAIDVRVADGTVQVLDRGPGIADSEQALVFERFHRSVEARTLPGSGLGLSIVRDVVTRHHGTVRVASRDGGGAVVGFTLPLSPSPPSGD